MKHVHAIGAALLASTAGLATGQCSTSCTEPGDCPPGFIQNFGYVSGACCVADTSTTRLCSKYVATFTPVDCRYTGVVAAVASAVSNATYSTTPGICIGSISGMPTATCTDTGPVADLDNNESSSAVACNSVSTNGVSSSHYASMFLSPGYIRAVSSSNVTNIVRSYYNNCTCESGGSGSGLGGGYADATTSGSLGLDCEPGGTVVADYDSSSSARITNKTAARNSECDGDPMRPDPISPIAAELARHTLIERNAKGEITATHTDTFFYTDYSDGTSYMQNTLEKYENNGQSGSRLIRLDPRTSTIDVRTSLQASGNPVTWATWIAFNHSVGSVWSDDNYRLEADLNLDGFIELADAELIFEHAGALDLNGDGEVSSRDVAAFLSLLASGDPLADLNMDGRLDVADFTQWKNAVQATPIASAAH